MKFNNIKQLVLALALISVGSVTAYAGGVNNLNLQQAAKRPYAAHVQSSEGQSQSAHADQAWEGATLQTDVKPDVQGLKTRKQQFREQLNLQYSSKRPYFQPEQE